MSRKVRFYAAKPKHCKPGRGVPTGGAGKTAVYQAKEHFEVAVKGYNDQVDNHINVVQMMKARIWSKI